MKVIVQLFTCLVRFQSRKKIAYRKGNICEVSLNIRAWAFRSRTRNNGNDAEHLKVCCDITVGFFTIPDRRREIPLTPVR